MFRDHDLEDRFRAILGLLLLASILSAASGCGMSATEAARRGLEGTSRVGALIDARMAEQRRAVSAAIIARPDATRVEHDDAMAPFDLSLEITAGVHRAVLATEDALDAADAGAESDWTGLMACVVSGLSNFVGLAARHVDLPDEVGSVLAIVTGLADGACPRPDLIAPTEATP